MACGLYRVPLYGEVQHSVYNSLHMHASMHNYIIMIMQTQKSVHKSNGFENMCAQYDITTRTRAKRCIELGIACTCGQGG